MERYKINLPIVVEGKYDKIKLASLFDASIVTLDGFSIFNSEQKQRLLRRISTKGIILFLDPDGAGKRMRSFISGILQKDKIFQVYIPKIQGKERRKTKPSRSGYLGVEGVDKELIIKALSPFIDNGLSEPLAVKREITKLDFYNDGFSGRDNSKEKRARLSALLDLPDDLTANALLEAVNIVCTKEEYSLIVKRLDG